MSEDKHLDALRTWSPDSARLDRVLQKITPEDLELLIDTMVKSPRARARAGALFGWIMAIGCVAVSANALVIWLLLRWSTW